MRFSIECIDRVGVVREVLDLLANERVSVQGIEVQNKEGNAGLLYLKIDEFADFQRDYFIQKFLQIPDIHKVEIVEYLPNERNKIELSALFESLPNPVLSIDLNGKVDFANTQSCKLLLPLFNAGKSRKKQISRLTGQYLADLIPQLVHESWYHAFLQQAAQTNTSDLKPLSDTIEIEGKTRRIDLLPVHISEQYQQKVVGVLVVIESHDTQRIDLCRFSVNQSHVFDDVVAYSPKMQALVEKAKKFALLDAPLLIQGETGTGKELIATACHHLSFRKDNKFIAVNCAGLPDEDAESEMFGRYDGEKNSIGFFEYADGGTVLLDGITELSLTLQAKLLRFLNDGTFRRVGEEQEHYANVRVICTSQGELQQYVAQGRVRADLFHRLNVLALTIPPLRERREDIPALVNLFIQQICRRLAISRPHFQPHLLDYLVDYPWPGNVRELYNALYRACSLAEDGELSAESLNLAEQESMNLNIEQFSDSSLEDIMSHFEATVLGKFYEQYPSTRKLATRLGLSHTAIANKLRQYGIGK